MRQRAIDLLDKLRLVQDQADNQGATDIYFEVTGKIDLIEFLLGYEDTNTQDFVSQASQCAGYDDGRV